MYIIDNGVNKNPCYKQNKDFSFSGSLKKQISIKKRLKNQPFFYNHLLNAVFHRNYQTHAFAYCGFAVSAAVVAVIVIGNAVGVNIERAL